MTSMKDVYCIINENMRKKFHENVHEFKSNELGVKYKKTK